MIGADAHRRSTVAMNDHTATVASPYGRRSYVLTVADRRDVPRSRAYAGAPARTHARGKYLGAMGTVATVRDGSDGCPQAPHAVGPRSARVGPRRVVRLRRGNRTRARRVRTRGDWRAVTSQHRCQISAVPEWQARCRSIGTSRPFLAGDGRGNGNQSRLTFFRVKNPASPPRDRQNQEIPHAD